MSTGVLLTLFVVCFVTAIVLNYKFKINIGYTAMAATYLIGSFCLNLSTYEIIDLWPVRAIFAIMTIPMFFSIPRLNGTMQKISKALLYAFRKQVWALPMIFFIVSWIIGVIGTGITTTTIMLSAVCFNIGLPVGMPVICIAAPVVLGACAGSLATWAGYGVIARGVLSVYFENAESLTMSVFFGFTVFSIILVLLVGLFWKGFKNRTDVNIGKPEPFNPTQKKTAIVMIVYFILALGPKVIQIFWAPAFIKYMTFHVDIQLISVLAALVCLLMKLADVKEVMEKGVPWSVYLMVGGMSMFLTLASKSGATAAAATWIANTFPDFLITSMFCVLGCILSCFSGALTMAFPLLCSMALPVAERIGSDPQAMIVAIAMGCLIASVSPFSAIGSLTATLCPDEEKGQSLFTTQMIVALMGMAVCILLTLVNFWSFFV